MGPPRTSAGWVIGGGLECALWNNVSLKAEYIFMKLHGQTVLMTTVPSATGNGLVSAVFDNDAFQIVRAGLNYHFVPR
jgi:outer membrane immunogenic protein